MGPKQSSAPMRTLEEKLMSQRCNKRKPVPEDLVRAAVSLASDDSRSITGQLIINDLESASTKLAESRLENQANDVCLIPLSNANEAEKEGKDVSWRIYRENYAD